MTTRVEQTGSFIAVDGRGNRHWLLVFTEYVRIPAGGKLRAGNTEGVTSITTTEGKHVERRAAGRYRVVETGLELTSDDPDAA